MDCGSLAASLLFPYGFLAELLRLPCGGRAGPFPSTLFPRCQFHIFAKDISNL